MSIEGIKQDESASDSELAKENRMYWLCECGEARIKIEFIAGHCKREEHRAELIDSKKGTVEGYLALNKSYSKYADRVPDSANFPGSKNDPAFPRD